ncbi:hypothetical protein [Methylocucumis oryzae]|uniref:Lipoprotein n=1 Tax=Methylocucumis oryzae TaxID=1632867 RepID=A0A0F3ILS9_9GAMM|nr:hypothetical protein [Methylocucumis oryzae]KJV07602.1 hypothetical protein VZ94_03755 [Methylocucumis oryzae]
MKKISIMLMIASLAFLTACNNGQKINGHTSKTAFKSVKILKNRLLPENRIEFEVAFWTIRDDIKDDKQFLSTVDGKTPEEIIAIAKEIYQQRKTAGVQEYTQYKTWEEMITRFGRERLEQDNRKSTKKESSQE